MVCHMTQSKFKVMDVCKLQKVYLLCQYTHNQTANGEFGYSDNIYIFPDRFLKYVLVWHHVTFKLKVVHIWEMNFEWSPDPYETWHNGT